MIVLVLKFGLHARDVFKGRLPVRPRSSRLIRIYFFFNILFYDCLNMFVGNEKKSHLARLLRLEKSMSFHKKAGKSSYFFLTGLPLLYFLEKSYKRK